MPWINRGEIRPHAPRRLVCFPHAGGSPFFFREWDRALPGFELHTVCYPGRAHRMAEPPATDLAAMAESVASALGGARDERPLCLFGHSMGAIVAYEVAARLEGRDVPVERLFVSAARAPHLVDPSAYRWDEGSVARLLYELGGTEAELLRDSDFMELVLPALRADFRMLASYSGSVHAPLRAPVTALLGEADPRVTADQARAWQRSTRGEFRLRVLPGGHFYLADDPPFHLIEAAVA